MMSMSGIKEEDDEDDAFEMLKKNARSQLKNQTLDLKKTNILGQVKIKDKRQISESRFGKSNKQMRELRELGRTSENFTAKISENFTAKNSDTATNHFLPTNNLFKPETTQKIRE